MHSNEETDVLNDLSAHYRNSLQENAMGNASEGTVAAMS
jgi:hypothetical protein